MSTLDVTPNQTLTSGEAIQVATEKRRVKWGWAVAFVTLALDRAKGVLWRINQRGRLVQVASGAFLIVMGILVFGNVMQLMSAYFYRYLGFFL